MVFLQKKEHKRYAEDQRKQTTWTRERWRWREEPPTHFLIPVRHSITSCTSFQLDSPYIFLGKSFEQRTIPLNQNTLNWDNLFNFQGFFFQFLLLVFLKNVYALSFLNNLKQLFIKCSIKKKFLLVISLIFSFVITSIEFQLKQSFPNQKSG